MLERIEAGNDELSISADFRWEGGWAAGPHVAALVGPNGSRKSLLLRLICEAALGRERFRQKGLRNLNLRASWLGGKPRTIICVSGTHLDRFPRPRATQPTLRRELGSTSYVHFGPRGANGSSGLRACERALVWTLLRNGSRGKNGRSSLASAFQHVDLKPRIYVYLQPTEKLRVRFGSLLHGSAAIRPSDILRAVKQEIERLGADREHDEYLADLKYVAKNWKDDDAVEIAAKIQELLGERPKATLLINDDRVLKRRGSLSLTTWKSLIAMDLIDIASTEFVPNTGRKIAGAKLSSGQWSWLAGFCGIAAEIQDDSLILIDEPENSLHPEWQRAYMHALLDVVEGYRGCQIIVATHSPFVAAGMPPGMGTVFRLTAEAGDGGTTVVRSENVGNMLGWRAADVYEKAFDVPTTRDGAFMKRANAALAAIRDNRWPRGTQVPDALSKLAEDFQRLPEEDPMRSVLKQILRSLESIEA